MKCRICHRPVENGLYTPAPDVHGSCAIEEHRAMNIDRDAMLCADPMHAKGCPCRAGGDVLLPDWDGKPAYIEQKARNAALLNGDHPSRWRHYVPMPVVHRDKAREQIDLVDRAKGFVRETPDTRNCTCGSATSSHLAGCSALHRETPNTPSTEALTPEAKRDLVIAAMPWYDDSNPDYTELDEAIATIERAVRREATDTSGLRAAAATLVAALDRGEPTVNVLRAANTLAAALEGATERPLNHDE